MDSNNKMRLIFLDISISSISPFVLNKVLAHFSLFFAILLTVSCGKANNDDTNIEPEKITISFDTQGGSVMPDHTVSKGTKLTTKPSDPTKNNLKFNGWYAETTGVNKINLDTYIFNETTTIYAQWRALHTFTINFHANKPESVTENSENVPTEPITVTEGQTATEPTPTPKLTKYDFKGWLPVATTSETLTLSDTAFDFSTAVNQNMELYAKWSRTQFTVTYHDNKPTGVTATVTNLPVAVSVNSEDMTIEPTPPPTLIGYNFAGWFTDVTTTTAFNFSSPIIVTTDIYAKWSQDPVIFFDTQGGGSINSQILTGTPKRATRPTQNPIREGYDFVDWYTQATDGNVVIFPLTVTASRTIYARWTRTQIMVTYHANKPAGVTLEPTGMPTDPIVINNEGMATKPSQDPELIDYIFTGWFEGTAPGTTLVLQDVAFAYETTPIRESKHIYATWRRATVNVTFYGKKPNAAPAGATIAGIEPNPKTISVNSGDMTTAPTVAPTLAGYNFKGWYIGIMSGLTLALADTAFDFENTIIRGENINLYTKWVQLFTVTYHGNKPTGVTAVVTGLEPDPMPNNVENGKTATEPNPAPRLTGYNFVGWFTEATGINTYSFSSTINEDKLLYAKWSQEPVVTFDTQGGTPVDSQILTETPKRAIRPTPNPTREPHYTFNNWYTLETGDEVFNFDQDITETKTTVYARWIRNTYAITFNQNYGNTPRTSIETTNQEGKVTPPDVSNLRVATHTFNGWYDASSGGDKIQDFTTEIFNGNKELFAQWLFKVVTITFRLNYSGATDTAPVQTNPQNGRVTPPTIPEARTAKYILKGWFTAKTGGDEVNLDTITFATPQEIFAQWKYLPETKAALIAEIDKVIATDGDNVDLNYIDTRLITDMSDLFKDKNSFNGNISDWNVSAVENMSGMFTQATVFNQDLSNWNVSSVKNMSLMFYGLNEFNGNISDWNVSVVENMSHMFYGAKKFNQDLSNWNVSTVNNMSEMFQKASVFNGNISNWNVSAVIIMRGMFKNAKKFNQDLGNWNVSSVNNMNDMFNDANMFAQNIDSWNVSAVKNMGGMFSSATAFNGNLSNWNVSAVDNMGAMFTSATTFNGNISNWNVSAVRNMNGIFSFASAFVQDIESWNVGATVTKIGAFVGSGLANTPPSWAN